MALVQYSDSESEAERDEAPTPPPARKSLRRDQNTPGPPVSLPPLPTNFHDLYASSTRVSLRDDPSLHGGRKRVIPHVEGNWPTHIYLEWYPSRRELNVLNNILSHCRGNVREGEHQIHSLLQSDLGVQLPLHISLSRPVVLVTDQKQSFTELFEQAIRESGLHPFQAIPDSLDWTSNYERTRWFLVMRVKKPESDELNRLLRLSNRSLSAFGQPPLYEMAAMRSHSNGNETTVTRYPGQTGNAEYSDDSPVDYSHHVHLSIAWSLKEPSLQEKQRVVDVDLRPLSAFEVSFSSVKAKIGNSVLDVPFPIRKADFIGL